VRVHLKGLASARKKLATGEVVTYYYAWRGGPRLPGQPGSPEFVAAYHEAQRQRKQPTKGTLFSLISEFRDSAEYPKAKSTRRAYAFYLRMIEAEFGDMPLAALEAPEIRGEFKAWRDTMADRPRTADYAWTTLARVLSVAKDRGRIPVNPCERGGRLYDGGRADQVWSEADLARVISCASPQMHLALILALWTGQRQGDLLRLPWSAYDGKTIRLQQSKTGRRVTIPVGAELKAMLDRTEKVGPLILTNTRGRPWTSDGFRASWGKLCTRAGIEDRTFHDIRGSAVMRLARSSASVPEIATLTGHSLKDAEAILDAHYFGRDVKLAENAIRKLERNERRIRSANRPTN